MPRRGRRLPAPGLQERIAAAGLSGLCPKPLRRDALAALLRQGRGAAGPPAPSLGAPRAEPLTFRGRVLVTDDNTVNQRVAAALLRRLGCAPGLIDVVSNGREALEALGRERYELVLMDFEMPEMDGLEATRALRRLPGPASQVAVLGLTGRAMPEDQEACRAAGMNGCLTKPVREPELRAAVGALLQVRAPAPPGP